MLWGFSRDEAVGQACVRLKGFFAGEAVGLQCEHGGSTSTARRVAGLVLVVSEVCTGECRARETRNRGARGAEWIVGRPASRAAMGMAEEERNVGNTVSVLAQESRRQRDRH
jgi:hypothetical protein